MDNKVSELSTNKLLVRMGLRILIILVTILFFYVFFSTGLRYLTPFILAYLISTFILVPIIKKMSVRLRKFWSIIFVILIMALTLAVVFAVIYYVGREGVKFVRNWDNYLDGVESSVKTAADYVGSHSKLDVDKMYASIDNIREKLDKWVAGIPERAPHYAGKVGGYLPSVGSFLMSFLFFLIATYFICYDHQNINSTLKSFIPDAIKPHLNEIGSTAGSATFGYLKAQVKISSIIGLIAMAVFFAMHQTYWVLFGLIVAIVDFIPMLGSAIILVPWGTLLFLTGDYFKAIVYFVLCFCLFMFRRIVEPRVVGNQTGLHPLVSLICLYVGIKVGGIIGMIIAPIICMIIIGLWKGGFFTPTYYDVAELIHRMSEYSEIKSKPDEKNAVSEKKEREEE